MKTIIITAICAIVVIFTANSLNAQCATCPNAGVCERNVAPLPWLETIREKVEAFKNTKQVTKQCIVPQVEKVTVEKRVRWSQRPGRRGVFRFLHRVKSRQYLRCRG